MRSLDTAVLRLREASRRATAALPTALQRWQRPASLVLQTVPAPHGDAPPEAANPAVLRRALVDAIAWLGPLPVQIWAGPEGASEVALELVRVAHRLGCPTELRCDGQGIDRLACIALVDAGLARARIVFADNGHVEDALDAIRALTGVRVDRRTRLSIVAELSWTSDLADHVTALAQQAAQAGADEVVVTPPWHAHAIAGADAALTTLQSDAPAGLLGVTALVQSVTRAQATNDGRPGLPRTDRCPVASTRVAVSPGGTVCACPFLSPAGALSLDGPSLDTLWRAAGAHREQIARCDRSCPHPALGGPKPTGGSTTTPRQSA